MSRLVDAGAKIDVLVNRRVPLLHVSADSSYRIGALRGLLEKGAHANRQDTSGKTALHRLFRTSSPSSTDALRFLLQHGASPEVADKAGESALHAVAHAGTLEQFQLCLASCYDPDAALRLRTCHNESLLHYAAAGGKSDSVRFLLSRGLDVNLASANGWTPLICALMPTSVRPSYPQCSLASLLLQHGASAHALTAEGWTALHSLASYPSGNRGLPLEKWDSVAPLVRELIARGAPLDAKVRALRNRAVIRDRFVVPDLDVWGSRMQSFARNQEAAAETAGSVEDPNTTPHMWAHRNGATEVFKAILEHKAEVAGEPESGR